jgi:predicted nucleic acid-binding protein
MAIAYLDTSPLLAIALEEPPATKVSQRIAEFDMLVSSNLLESEFRSTLEREKLEWRPPALDQIEWILPDRALSDEISRVLAAGYVRGADLWHLASALYFSPDPGELTFVTLDERQREVAAKVGFTV